MQTYKTVLITLFFIIFCFVSQAQNPKREMRGVWVATVKNLDWPSKSGLTTEEQQREIDKIISHVKELGLNAVFLQIRPEADAFYQSSYEPWSKFLTGEEGRAPKPFYDPLEYWLLKAKQAGIDVHAWINPFRLTSKAGDELSPEHPVSKHPDWIVRYNDKLYLDPGVPGARNYINAIVADIVKRYDIAGIHMDDYFYPYPVNGVEFPDTVSYAEYCDTLIFADRDEWRRDNVNRIVESISGTIKQIKPWVSFGISPFGVWRNVDADPRGSDTRAGITNYDMLHADVLTWLKNGWVDYVVPQIYWYMDHPAAGFRELADWWNRSSYGVPVYAGMSIYKINSAKPEWQNPEEMPDQIRLIRTLNNFGGSLFFRYAFLKNDLLGLQDSLKYRYYSSPAITPAVKSSVDIRSLRIKKVRATRKKLKWKIDKDDAKDVKYFVVYSYPAGEVFNPNDTQQILTVTGNNFLPITVSKRNRRFYRVSVIDKYGNEGDISKAVD